MAKAGRPKGNNNKEYSYTISMDESVKNRLDAYCEKRHIAKADAIRDGILFITNEADHGENAVCD